MGFMQDDFLLQNEFSIALYKEISTLPIIDFHCHLSPREIYEDKDFDNIVDLWLSGDHYKWRAMRAQGIPEEVITGGASNEEKFRAWAETVEHLIGNPLYHWSHLEMKNVFGWTEPLTSRNWEKTYHYMNQFIKANRLSPRKLINIANVKFIGTTDDPLDSLEFHRKIREDKSINTSVAPTFRPDTFFSIENNFNETIEKLEALTSQKISSYQEMLTAISKRIDFFILNGCRASDHSFGEFVYLPVDEKKIEDILKRSMKNEKLTSKEILQWQSTLFMDLSKIYKAKELVVQVHFGALRNNNSKMYRLLGADSGFDSMTEQNELSKHLNAFLDTLSSNDKLPKMIFYNLNPSYNTLVVNTLANFQENQEGITGKLQHGAAWWFNDTKSGMIDQMITYANQGVLSHFIGMLTDSRSFLSYQRHDYFRRILCEMVGQWIEGGEVPYSERVINMMQDIAYRNAEKYFGV